MSSFFLLRVLPKYKTNLNYVHYQVSYLFFLPNITTTTYQRDLREVSYYFIYVKYLIKKFNHWSLKNKKERISNLQDLINKFNYW